MALRLAEYISNRSIWLDEAFLALNILRRPLVEMVRPLDFNQGAPIGFLSLEKFAAATFGGSEYSLRLFPLLAGISALLLFLHVAVRLLPPAGATLAVALFAVSDGLIRYSAEAKQYEFDVLSLLVLMALALSLLAQPTRRLMYVAATVGGVTTLFSYAAIIVAPALGVVLVVVSWRDGNRLSRERVVPAVAWTVSAGLAAVLAAYQLSHLRGSFRGLAGNGSAPGAVVDQHNVLTPIGKGVAALAPDLGLPYHGAFGWFGYLFVLAAGAGATWLWRRNAPSTALVLAPVVAATAAVALGLYPLLSRTVLFLLPIFILCASAAVAAVLRSHIGAVAGVVLAIFLIALPANLAAEHLVRPRHLEEIKGGLAYIKQHWRQGDALYLHYASQYAFAYYGECSCFVMTPWPVEASARASTEEFSPALRSVSPTLFVGPYRGERWREYLRDTRRVFGRGRVWFLFTHASSPEESHFERETFPAFLDRHGRRKLAYVGRGTRVYLYDLSTR